MKNCNYNQRTTTGCLFGALYEKAVTYRPAGSPRRAIYDTAIPWNKESQKSSWHTTHMLLVSGDHWGLAWQHREAGWAHTVSRSWLDIS